MKFTTFQAVAISIIIGIATLFFLRQFSVKEGMDGSTATPTTTESTATPTTTESTATPTTTESTATPTTTEERAISRVTSDKSTRYWGSRGTGDGHSYYWNYPLYWSDFYGPPYIVEPAPPKSTSTQTIIVEQQPEPNIMRISMIGPFIILVGIGAVGWALVR